MKTLHKTLSAILFALLAVTFFAACSSDSDDDSISASDLEGTTWTASLNGQTVATLNFASGGTVNVWMMDETGDDEEEYNYSVSGSTVTIYDDGEAVMQLTYSSGQLVYSAYGGTMTFTKS